MLNKKFLISALFLLSSSSMLLSANDGNEQNLKKIKYSLSSFISTVGGAPLEIVKQYIENQQASERPKEKNKWKNYLKECEVKND